MIYVLPIYQQEEIARTCKKHIECMEAILQSGSDNPKIIKGEFLFHL